MTMHNAKGLEFPVVFVTGLEDGLFPLARAYDDPAMLEEERRLFYVGITRAERKLFLTRAEQRRRNGELLPGKPSAFLAGIPGEMLDSRLTPRAQSTGRSFIASRQWEEDGAWGRSSGGPRRGSGSGYGSSSYGSSGFGGRGAGTRSGGSSRPATDASQLGWSTPARRAAPPAEEEISQDAAVIAVGARVKHPRFGSGTIAELSGSGRDTKARIDFDDETVGRKTLVVAQANLEREWE